MGSNDHGSKMRANYDYAYEAMLCEKFHKRTPARVFDAHFHLSHYTDVLRHPKNIEQIRYLSAKYPNSKIILAHCGMGHNPYKMRDGLA